MSVYYTVSKVNIHTSNNNHPYDATKRNIEYYLESSFSSKTLLITNVTGYLHSTIIS